MELIFDKSVPGRRGVRLPSHDVPDEPKYDARLLRKAPPALPEVSELDAIRHFTRLSQLNAGVDTHFYPLGSCTMKYNPKLGEQVARLEGFAGLHPLLPQLRGGGLLTQGALAVLHECEQLLCEITGMGRFTMQPLAGAHGELTGIMMIAAWHRSRGAKKTKMLVPDSSHGTNPASAAIAGYKVVSVKSNAEGLVDLDALKEALNDDGVAGLMMTCPNTLGLFEKDVAEICRLVHDAGGLMYYDGANLNAILGKCRPGDIGFDIMHINLHKTFATPHGSGGPGAGPVGVTPELEKFLPISLVVKREDGTYALDYDRPDSIGYIAPFYGNFGIILRAYSYILTLGREGLIEVAENAVLNANYLMELLRKKYQVACDGTCMHEFVVSAVPQAKKGATALDIAKSLIDRGFHPPSVYFPLTVKEAMMIEPTETESKETLDVFAQTMLDLADLIETDPNQLKAAPVSTPVSRLDLTAAERNMDFGV
jgi:glycine dehydrogenase subunit 2